jgi:oligosaccharide repeat unit polymerase
LYALTLTGVAVATPFVVDDFATAWVLWGVCAMATLPVAVWGLVRDRFFEPLPLLAAACGVLFVLRPFQLFIEWQDLYSYFPSLDPVRRLTLLEGQEVARFVGERVEEPLATALARALAACAVFLAVLLLGYRLGAGTWLARRLEQLGSRARPMNPNVAIGCALAIGLVAQVLIVVRAGGPAASLEAASDQVALSESFVLFVLAGFAPAGVIVWAAWCRPRRRAEWAAFVLSVTAVCAFSVIAGSRGRIFLTLVALAVVVHFAWRPWRRRELVVGVGLLLAFVSSFLVFREVANDRSLKAAAEQAPRYVLDTRVIANDITSFDHVLYATTIYGRERDHRNGRFFVGAVRSFLPSALDPGKPEGGDIVFRKAVWGNDFRAGRPPTVVGDLFIDFGFAGVAIGGLLVGLLSRSLIGLLAGPFAGRQYRIALYAILLLMLYEVVADTFSLALGYALTLLLPFLVAVHVFGRLPGPGRPART